MNPESITHLHSMYHALLYLVGVSLALAGYIHWHEAIRKSGEGEVGQSGCRRVPNKPAVGLLGLKRVPNKPAVGLLGLKQRAPQKQRLPS